MTLNTVPGLWNSDEGKATHAGMERACHAKMEFAQRIGPAPGIAATGPKSDMSLG